MRQSIFLQETHIVRVQATKSSVKCGEIGNVEIIFKIVIRIEVIQRHIGQAEELGEFSGAGVEI